MFKRKSWKALRYRLTRFFSPSGPLPRSGVEGSWCWYVGAIISSATCIWPLFQSSSKRRRTTVLFCSDIMVLLKSNASYQLACGELGFFWNHWRPGNEDLYVEQEAGP